MALAEGDMKNWSVPPGEVPEEVAELLGSRGAAQINLYKALSNSPEMVRAWTGFIWTLRDDCVSPRALRELVILRTAARHRSLYEWHHHARMASQAGLSDEQIESVVDWEKASCYTEREKVALELTDAVCDCSISADLAERAMDQLGARTYVELSVTAGAYVMVPRILEVLGVPLESETNAEVAPWDRPPG